MFVVAGGQRLGQFQHQAAERGFLPQPIGHIAARGTQRAGYHTAAFASSFVLDSRFGWDRGFDHYDASFDEPGATLSKRRAYEGAFWTEHEFGGLDRRGSQTTDAALRWLEDAEEPFFLFVHYFDPHMPYVPPEEFAKAVAGSRVDLLNRGYPGLSRVLLARLIRNYHAEVLYTDRQLGRLLEGAREVGGDERTLVVVTADHGEGLGQHEWLEHGVHLYEEQVHVPLLLSWPGGLPAGLRIGTAVGLVDVAPTVAALAGVPFDGPLDGRSLADDLRAGSQPQPRAILGQRRAFETRPRFSDERFSLRTERWKYIRSTGSTGSTGSPDELFDLVEDPGELDNAHERHAEVVAELSEQLRAQLEDAAPGAEVAPIDPETRRKLEALGYVD